MTSEREPVVVLFSGGRDSSLVACLLAKDGFLLHLFTCNNGVSVGVDLSEYRYNELVRVFGEQIHCRTVASTFGVFRRIALADIETDFARCEKNMIILGSQLAIHAEAIHYCLANGVRKVASGFVAYQKSFAEQMPDAVGVIREFMAEYGIEYMTPVCEYESSDDVKYRLLDFGVSTKSLEAVSIFSDTFSEPSSAQVLDYINAKLPICRDYISFKRSHRQGSDS